MVKPKKSKKGRGNDDWEEGVVAEISELSLGNPESTADENGHVGAAVTKKKSKPKISNIDSEEDDDDDPEVKGDNKKPAAMSAFQMLAVDSDDQHSSSSDQEEYTSKPVQAKDKKKSKPTTSIEEDAEASKEATPEPVPSKNKGKKKGKPEKKEEDIDALLAEIEAPKQDTGKGKKKKKGKVQADTEHAEVSMDLPTESEAAAPAQQGLEKDVSLMTEDEIAAWLDGQFEEDDKKKKKKNKKAKQEETKSAGILEGGSDDEEPGAEGTMKTAAQKKKEKKERQKQQKLQEKSKPKTKAESKSEEKKVEDVTEQDATSKDVAMDVAGAEPLAAEGDEEDGMKKKKKDRKKKKKGEAEDEEEKKDKKKPSKLAKGILEMQKKLKEEEERLKREEEEEERMLEEKQRQKEEQEKKDRERKERDKQKKKEKIERQKAEGTYLTAKQKLEKQRAAQMLENLKAQGIALPQPTEKKKKVVYERKKKKSQVQENNQDVTPTDTPVATPVEELDVQIKVEDVEKEMEKKDDAKDSWEDDIKDEWDAESEEEEPQSPEPVLQKSVDEENEDDESEEDDSDEEESEEESDEETSEEESEEEDEKLTPKERAMARIERRKEDAESERSTDLLRAPVVCVLGHVDTGKTKILDKLRRTHVQDDEAGGITQQIGATNVPVESILEQTKMCKEFAKQPLKVPGLLIIDTPGHESFSNLRTRGSSLCDIAILVIDIMHGLEPQTIESIELLKKGKTPFIVALNKVDRLYQWQSNPHNDIVNTLKKQKLNTRQEFDERTQMVIVQLAEQGLNACLFYENKNVREYVSMVPTSAHSGDGLGNLMALICEFSQSLLAKRVSYSQELQATVMEVKAIQGLGTTIDVILVNGSLRESETIIIAGQEGPIVTQIRALLMPQPMKELRVKNAYTKHKEVVAAQGCKIIAKDIEKALAGLPLYVAKKTDEVEVYREEISDALEDVLGSIKLQDRGVFVQASTLGSLEALLEFLRTSKIPYAGINIGPVHKRDIMKASVMLEHDSQWAVILAFDVKVERDAQEMADSVGVTIFSADIIYHLFDKFIAHRDGLKKRKQEEFKHIAMFPCQVRILPQFVFNSRDPIVCGVIIQAGFLKEGTILCVPSKEFLDVGRVTSIENNHKPVNKATKGQEVCIKIESIPGDTPKLFGRHFDETDLLVSKLSRESIDAVKNYFRDEMTKGDWQLIMELKKTFEIL